jgi:hypothetical protein
MAYESRLTLNYCFGTLSLPAAISDTTLNSDDFAARLPVGLSTGTYVPITLQDPSTGNYEIVWATAHSAGSTTATVIRARESSSSRAWASGTLWTVSPTLRDGLLPVPNRNSLPGDAHIGLRAYLQDEMAQVQYAGTSLGWVGVSSGGTPYRVSQVLSSDTPTIAFTNVPNTLKRLLFVWSVRSASAAQDSLRVLVNNDQTALNYPQTYSTQVGGTFTPSFSTGQQNIYLGAIPGNAQGQPWTWQGGEMTIIGLNSPGGRTGINWLARVGYFYDGTFNMKAESIGVFKGTGPYVTFTFGSSSGTGINLKAGSEVTAYGWT